MDSLTEIDRTAILRVVRTWTDDERLRLVLDILRMIRTDRTTAAHVATFEQARGLLKLSKKSSIQSDLLLTPITIYGLVRTDLPITC